MEAARDVSPVADVSSQAVDALEEARMSLLVFTNEGNHHSMKS